MQTFHRTATCGDARAELAGQPMTLAGWVHRRRDLGQLIFLDLRDRYGITQVVLDRATAPAAHAVASEVRPEFVIRASGLLAKRLPGTENPRLPTGEVELRADVIDVLGLAYNAQTSLAFSPSGPGAGRSSTCGSGWRAPRCGTRGSSAPWSRPWTACGRATW